MRAIKFRAWDGKRIVGPKEFALGATGEPFVFIISIPPREEYRPDWKLMQFTGLKDKNGAEIYEGDIINFYWPDYAAHFDAREVFYHVDAFCVKRDKDIILLGDVDQREVIGNIYENPELLESR